MSQLEPERERLRMTPLQGKGRQSVKIADHRLNLWEGSVRSSKTVSSLIAWVEFSRKGPAGNLAMIGKTERTLKRNVIDPLVDMLGPKRARYIAGAGEFWLLGRRIYVAGANNEAAVAKIQGLTLAGAYVDEVTTLPESFWAMLLTRLSIEGARLFGTMNPDNPNHWVMRDYLKRARTWLRHDGTVITSDDPTALDLARFSFRLADNHTLSDAYLTALAAEFTGLWRLRYIEGLWVLAEGAIYDTFDPTPDAGHVVTALPAMRRWVLAVDYGTVNPFVCGLIGVGVDDRIYIAREFRWDSKARRAQKTDAEYSAALRTWLAGCEAELGPIAYTHVFVDPSAASFVTQLWRDGWQGVTGANNAVLDGIRAVSSLRSADRLKIHESCPGIAEETSYVWDEKAAAKGVEQPLKVDDHFPDMERYAVAGLRNEWRHWMTAPPLDEAA